VGSSLTLVTAPTSEPITLTEAKAHCRVDHSLDDARFAALILAAREWGQGLTHKAFLTQTWDYSLDCFPDEIKLPMSPVQSITSVKYYDTDNTEQTLSSSAYITDVRSHVPRISLADGYDWPDTYYRYHPVTVRFVAGYTSGAADLYTIRAALLLHVEAHYDRTENFDRLVQAAESLLLPLRVVTF
jgi:uncharacterized phiE125 gp8 family phage protein